MYKYQDIRVIHLEITSKCQASCPMCPRNIHGGILNPSLELSEVHLEQFKKWFDKEFISQLSHISMCGNYGDPIIASDILPILEYIRVNNSNCSIKIHTNGSARNKQFWESLAKLNVVTMFGIDGLEDTHKRYRIGTDFHKIIQNAKYFIDAGGEAVWDMLVFQHNQHQITECKTLSENLGFSKFVHKNTTRFLDDKWVVLNRKGETVDILYPTEKSQNFIFEEEKSKKEINPTIKCKVLQDNSIYVGANGNLTPCCWLDADHYPFNADDRIDYMDKMGGFPNLNSQSLQEIFSSGYFKKIQEAWETPGCLKICKSQCGSFDKLNVQFDNL